MKRSRKKSQTVSTLIRTNLRAIEMALLNPLTRFTDTILMPYSLLMESDIRHKGSKAEFLKVPCPSITDPKLFDLKLPISTF